LKGIFKKLRKKQKEIECFEFTEQGKFKFHDSKDRIADLRLQHYIQLIYKPFNADKAYLKFYKKVHSKEQQTIWFVPNNIFKYAAIITILLGSTFFTYNTLKSNTQNICSNIIETTSVTLNDGSMFHVSDLQCASYVTDIFNSRHIDFKGEAIFEIVSDPEKPFVINLPNQLKAEVLGTSFYLDANEDLSQFKATLFSGSLQIVDTKSSQIYLLSPGESIIFDNKSNGFTIENHFDSENAQKKNFNLEFRNKSLHEVTQTIARIYHLDIEISSETSKSLKITASFNRFKKPSEMLKTIANLGGLQLLEINHNNNLSYLLTQNN